MSVVVAEAAALNGEGRGRRNAGARAIMLTFWPMATIHNALGLSSLLASNTTLAAPQSAVDCVAKYLAKPTLQLECPDTPDMPELAPSNTNFDFDFDDMPELVGTSSSDVDDMPDLGALALNALEGMADTTNPCDG